MQNLFYSFGIAHPREITLDNYASYLRLLVSLYGKILDLATTNIICPREHGLPRDNGFRELLHSPSVLTFEEPTDTPVRAQELRRVYKDGFDLVYLIVRLYAEPKADGVGCSDSAFRTFILMASRRPNNDRFYKTYFTSEVYTPFSLVWVYNKGMPTVLLIHLPTLSAWLHNVKHAFFPWKL